MSVMIMSISWRTRVQNWHKVYYGMIIRLNYVKILYMTQCTVVPFSQFLVCQVPVRRACQKHLSHLHNRVRLISLKREGGGEGGGEGGEGEGGGEGGRGRGAELTSTYRCTAGIRRERGGRMGERGE